MAQLLVRSWPRPTGPRIPELARFDTNVQTILQQYAIPGGSLAVVKEGRLVFTRGYGWADVEHHEPFQPDSLCQIQSLSKTITAATVLKLVEEGKLTLDTPAFALLNLDVPSYPGAAFDPRMTNITVRQLLNHTAGWNCATAKNPLGGTGFDPVFWGDQAAQDLGLMTLPTPTDIVRWMLGKPLQNKPGAQNAYSNLGYVVAARIIEKISGRSFETAAQQCLAPAGITRLQLGGNTRWERVAGETVYYLSPGTTYSDQGLLHPEWRPPKPLDFDLPYAWPITVYDAAGGLMASAIDYGRFLAAIDGLTTFPDLLNTNTVKTMATGSFGWDLVDSSNPSTGIWYKVEAEIGVNAVGAKWKNGVGLVFVLNSNSSGNSAMSSLWNSLTESLGTVRWPTHDLFAATLSYPAWRGKYFAASERDHPSLSSDTADPDGDGVVNWVEYAQGTDPRLANEPARLAISIQTQEGAPSLVLSFRRLLLGCEVDYQIEVTTDMRTWSPVTGETGEPTLNADGTLTVSVCLGAPADFPARFFRLRVSRR